MSCKNVKSKYGKKVYFTTIYPLLNNILVNVSENKYIIMLINMVKLLAFVNKQSVIVNIIIKNKGSKNFDAIIK